MYENDIINPANDKNHIMCAQFLRDFIDIDLFKNIQPEDIIDETDTYQAYLGIKFETDTVKRIQIKNLDFPLYIISLIEHKSNVDYNVAVIIQMINFYPMTTKCLYL